ncbi:hypothetical protein BDZ45DRAFT_807938 [Acephala macrosclerotiorum]|nr:hypothetical protein BDZ45DRAFT_807938 [Acephala macrosclerotiorum]
MALPLNKHKNEHHQYQGPPPPMTEKDGSELGECFTTVRDAGGGEPAIKQNHNIEKHNNSVHRTSSSSPTPQYEDSNKGEKDWTLLPTDRCSNPVNRNIENRYGAYVCQQATETIWKWTQIDRWPVSNNLLG